MGVILDSQRTLCAQGIERFAAYRWKLHYVEERPLPIWTPQEFEARAASGESLDYDCSWSFEQWCDWAGLLSPSGPRWPFSSGAGNTTTIFDFMPHIRTFNEADTPDFSDCHVGTGVGFMAPPENLAHITMIHTPDPRNPMLGSFGYQGSPVLVDYETERPYHPGMTVVLLDISALGTGKPDPHHYLWFEDFVRPVAHGESSERESVMHYDEQRVDQAKNHVNLIEIQENLQFLAEHLEGVMHAEDPRGLLYHRAWRLNELKMRAAGYKVV